MCNPSQVAKFSENKPTEFLGNRVPAECQQVHTNGNTTLCTRENEDSGDSCNTTGISKRALKKQQAKIDRKLRNKYKPAPQPKAGPRNFSEDCLKKTEYYFQNGLRKVYPYHFTHQVYTKQRWLGRTILDVCRDEWLYLVQDLEQHIACGKLTVNGETVQPDMVLKYSDYIENTVHVHELPVTGAAITVIHEDEEVLVLNKPCSIPVHPVSRYRHNSLTFILAKEYGYKNLRIVHRLDRLTSGVLIFAKNLSKCNSFREALESNSLHKEYLCRVVGEFPTGNVTVNEPIQCMSRKMGINIVHQNGKQSHTDMQRLSFNGKSSLVRCTPRTGRTHQIRVHLQWLGYPIVNDPMYNSCAWGPVMGKGGDWGKTQAQLEEDITQYHGILNSIPGLDCSQSVHADTKFKLSIEKKNKIDVSNNILSSSERCDTVSLPLYDASKEVVDADCVYCMRKCPLVPESAEEMYLHAWKYKGPDWEYTTPWPHWAQQDYQH